MKTTWLILALCALSAAEPLTQGTVGQTVIIPCGTGSGDNIEWKVDGELVHSKNHRNGFDRKGVSRVSSRATLKRKHLEIINVQEGDSGFYICEVDGKEHYQRLFVISVRAIPPGVLQLDSEAKLECQVHGLQPMPTLQWVKPDGLPGGSEVVHLNSVAKTDAGSWVCKFSKDGKTYLETLEVKVQVGPDTALERVTTPPLKASTPSKTKASNSTNRGSVVSVGATESQAGPMLWAGINLWIWVAVAVGCFVLLVLVGCVIALYQRNKRTRTLKRRTSRQPLQPKQYCQCDRSTGAVGTMAPPPRRHNEKPSTRPPRQQP